MLRASVSLNSSAVSSLLDIAGAVGMVVYATEFTCAEAFGY